MCLSSIDEGATHLFSATEFYGACATAARTFSIQNRYRAAMALPFWR
jgi:hypothetical protein